MKKTFTLIALIITLITFAQAPQGFNYQATVRNAAGTLIVNQNVYFRFNIMLNSQTSVPVFSETHYVPTDDLGQVNIIVGTGTATTGTFSTIDWGTGNYYLGIELNIGNGYVAMGTTQLLSVPYALYSNRSGNSNFNFPNGTNIGDTLNWIWNGSAWVPTSSVSTAQLPVISTTVATNILTPSPSSGGTITSDGGFSITSKGVCWSINPNPTINDNITNNGTGASNFTSILSNLLPTTTYYYRAYATNSIGTSYGITYTFTTVAIPQLTTTPINYITYGTVAYPHSGGTISNDGGAEITSKGVVWSTSPNPTVTTNQGRSYNGTGTDTYASNLNPFWNPLLPGTLYYVRAYATNSYGTAYGQEEVFTTLAILPTLSTTTTSEITSTTAISGGTISSDGGASITDKGIVWSTSPNPTITTNQGISSEGTGIDAFSSTITQLTPGTVYYVRSYATNTIGTVYGQEEVFTTLAILPNLTTKLVSNITSTTAISGGNNTYDGGDYIMIKGIVWNTTPNPTTTSNQGITYEGEDNGAFTSALNQLLPNTFYYVRAYATNSIGTAYGQEEVFTTLVGVPILTTTSVAEITITTARSGGSISNDGGVSIINKGMVWSTSPNPTVITNEGITSDGSGMDTFTSTITQLTPGTLYYVRAYATNSIGTGYGQEVVFTTLSTLPTLTTTLVSDITSYTAYSGGIITNDGGDYIIDKGIVWSTNPNPTTTTNIGITYDGQGIDAFTSILNQMLPGTLYYVRAYATNTIGTAYGQEEVFTTLAILPTLTTTLVSDMTSTTASSGGTILNDGGTSIIDKGIVWSTTTDPTITLNEGITSEGNGIDAFTSTITQLIPGTLYYLRAYATNSIGTAYGQEEVFTTVAIVPTLTTTLVTDITSETAISGGIITNDGGDFIINKGIVWSTSPNPTTTTNLGITFDGQGIDAFTSALNQLSPGTLFYVRAFAINNVGTAYGQQEVFTTLTTLPTLTTTLVSNRTNTTASSGGTISNDGGTPIIDKGIVWSTLTDPTITTNEGITSDGTGISAFTSVLNQLLPGTSYYVRAYATNINGTAYGEVVTFTTPLPVTIGTQVWSNTNLDVTTYRDGTPIPQVTDPTAWANLTTGAWCYYNNDPTNGAIYGKLYNWYAVAGIHDTDSNTPNKVLAPTGWHIPSDTEWNTLTTFLGGGMVAGGKLKSTGTTWISPNIGATNESSFTGLPGGYRFNNGNICIFTQIGRVADWWSLTEFDAPKAWNFWMLNNSTELGSLYDDKSDGYSVRCIRD